MSTTVRVSESTHKRLRAVAKKVGHPISAVIDLALDAYTRDRFFAELDEAYEKLRSDPAAWKDELDERRELEGSLIDDLEDS